MSDQHFAAPGRKGFVTVYMVFTMLTLIPMAGLAIDCTVLYNVKARLQAAVDAAALGAGAMLQSSTDLSNSTQVANIQDAAQRFFNANYPSGYWGTTQAYYSATPSQDPNTQVRTIYVHAEEYVPMLFLRVLRINSSTVAAQATSSVRFVSAMIVVDRSGSVVRGGNNVTIQNALNSFVVNTPSSTPAGQSLFVDGRDVIGMVSFGGTTGGIANNAIDYPPVSNFRSGASKISTTITNIPFGNNGTNTAEGLYQAYQQLLTLNNTGALNVIILLTDGRPSAFTVTMTPTGSSTCTNKTAKTGFITANVAYTWPPPPPTTQGGQQGVDGSGNPVYVYTFGLYNQLFTGMYGSPCPSSCSDMAFVANSGGCYYNSTNTNAYKDFPTFPATDVHGYSTTGPYYPGNNGNGQSLSDPAAVRYASFNVADNVATAIRQDTTIRPVMFVIGLNEPPAGGEPLDADWLARVANDPNYINSSGNPVYQSGQTAGLYYNVTGAGLAAAFQDISAQILRLSQ